MQEVYRHIERNLDGAVKELEKLCALPSVSAQGQAIAETAEFTAEMFHRRGFTVQVLPKRGNANPVVYATLKGRAAKTLLIYNHYDVQPPEPMDLWSSPPFHLARRGDKLYARGVCDNKGHLVSRLAALDALRSIKGELPVSVKFCVEGDEEIGSPEMETFVQDHRDLLEADACLWEGSGVDWNGNPEIALGVKGLLYVELEARTAARDSHSQWATVVPSAAWRLAWALATLKDSDEKVLIKGFYDDVRPATSQERSALMAMSSDEAETARNLEIPIFLGNVRDAAYRERHYLEPTCNINGLTSGYQGPGAKTVLPSTARAKLDFRLVPDQSPQDILAKLRSHLNIKGFSDIQVHSLTEQYPARTPPDDPFVLVVKESARGIYPGEPALVPTMAGTGPLYPIVNTLGVPTADFGISYPDSRIHAPDENIRLNDFLNGTKHMAALLQQMASIGEN